MIEVRAGFAVAVAAQKIAGQNAKHGFRDDMLFRDRVRAVSCERLQAENTAVSGPGYFHNSLTDQRQAIAPTMRWPIPSIG